MSFRNKNSGKALLPFGLDYSDVLSTDHTIEKPQLLFPINGSLTASEEVVAKQSITFSKLILNGPFYTGSVESVAQKRNKQPQTSVTAADGIQRYSDKYKKVKKVGRTIEEHPYHLEFFPDELYSVMGITNKQKKKLLSLSSYKADGGLTQFTVNESTEDKTQLMLDKLKDMAEDLDANSADAQKEEDRDDEPDYDDEFEEDDDDDYNAEKYFDDGDDDMGGDDGDDEAAF